MSTKIQKKLKNLPDTPGIYLFYNFKKELVYVGKATSLKSRVRSYFNSGNKTSRPIEALIHEVADIKWKEADSVLEAIIMEANHIKKYQPKYNVDGKDDKSWNYIVITKDEYPRVETVRQHELENVRNTKDTKLRKFNEVFGPYPGLNTKETLKLLRKIFTYSTCQSKKAKKQESKKVKPCFYYQLGQCLGVCTGEISSTEYKAKVIRPLKTFLGGRQKQLIKSLEVKMRKESKLENFEEAARLRNQISALQRIHDVALLNKSFVDTPSGLRPAPPKPSPGRPAVVSTSPRGRGENSDSRKEVIRIEGYDISNFGATGKVGSMVVFEFGEAKKKDYRKFKIKSVVGQSDVDCLEEVLERRLRHAKSKEQGTKNKKDFWPLPQVFLIDGGKPQVNRAKKVLKDNKVDVPVVGIAKGPDRKKNEFILGSKNKDFVKWVYSNQKLLIAVRDEAHRFAIAYQRKLRKL